MLLLNGSFILHGTGNGNGTGKRWVSMLRYVLYILRKDRTGILNHCFLLWPSPSPVQCVWDIMYTNALPRFRWFIFILQDFFSFLVAFVTRTSLLRGDQLSMSKETHYPSYMYEQESVQFQYEIIFHKSRCEMNCSHAKREWKFFDVKCFILRYSCQRKDHNETTIPITKHFLPEAHLPQLTLNMNFDYSYCKNNVYVYIYMCL